MTLSANTLVRLAVGGLAAATLAACASHPPPPPTSPIPPPAAENGPPPEQYDHNGPPPGPQGPIPGSSQDFVVNVGDRVYFDLDQFTIRPDAMDTLAKQAQWLNRYTAVQVRIEGNCDERGTEEYNFGLGARRAESVREFLINHGVDGSRITTVSYGKARPIDPGDNEDAWSKNRNAHTAITAGAQ